MIRLLNKKSRQVEAFKPEDALLRLRLEGDTYLPLNGEDYIVRGDDGQFTKTDGSTLYQTLGDTSGKLVTQDQFAIETAVKAEYSRTGQFLKSALSESLFLGLNKEQALPDDALSRAIEIERRKQFGGAETGGSIVGSIAPLVAGGVGGILKAGAKAGAKKALAGKTLEQAGKLPSALVFKGASKAGKLAKEGAEKLGIKGPKKLSAIEALGVGTGFAGLEAGIAGLKEAKKTAVENESKTAEDTIKSVLGQGVIKAGETFLSTGALIAGFSGAGKAIQLAGKGAIMGGKLAGLTPQNLREKFFKTYFSSVSAERLAKSFPGKDRAETARKASEFVFGIADRAKAKGGPTFKYPSTRTEWYNLLVKEYREVGKQIGDQREFLDKLLPQEFKKQFYASIYATFVQTLKTGKSLKGATIEKPFYNEIRRLATQMEQKLLDKNANYDLKFINEIMDIFAKKANYLKRVAKETDLDKKYRKAYARISEIEDQLFTKAKVVVDKKAIGTTPIPEHLKSIHKYYAELKKNKDDYSRIITTKDLIDGWKTPGGAFFRDFFAFRDFLPLALGSFGYGASGAIIGAGIAVGGGLVRSKGYKYLQVARAMEQGNQVLFKNKTIGGVRSILNTPAEHADLSISGLSSLFFGKSIKSLSDFEDQLNSIPPQSRYISGQPDLFAMIEHYGGRDNAVNFMAKTAQMKRDIVSLMPQPSFDDKGNKGYSKADKDRFLMTINQGISPLGFVKAVRTRRLTLQGFNLFKKSYPSWLSDFNVNFLDGVRKGQISQAEGGFYKSFLNSQNSTTSDFIFSNLDRDRASQVTSPPRRQFRSRQPTSSEVAEGGAFAS